jgi:crotonobetainyl-CoA:carnitine CoA-transferase CaiB-like acyl-CoA transferase
MYAARDDIHRALSKHFAKETTEHWIELLYAHDIWCAPVQSYVDIEKDPQVLHKGLIWEVPFADGGESYRTVGSPFTFSSTPAAVRKPTPSAGQNNEEFKNGEIWED